MTAQAQSRESGECSSLMARISERHRAKKATADLEARLFTAKAKQIRRELREAAKQYPLLLDCYRTGQVAEAQWTKHLQDPHFAAWVRKQESKGRVR